MLKPLLCMAEQAGSAENNRVSISIDSDAGPNPDGIGQATITITHGASESTHIATYEDSNDSGTRRRHSQRRLGDLDFLLPFRVSGRP
jgi:hypothetical protein